MTHAADKNNGVLADPPAGNEKQGVVGAQQRSVYGNTRAASTDTTQLVVPAVGLSKKSNVLDQIQLVLIELPKFQPTTIKERKLMILWLRFLKEINEKTREIDPRLLEVEEIKKALTLLEIVSYNEEELLAYDQRWDAVSSEKTMLIGKFTEGLAKGREEGEAIGLAKGKAEGIAEAKTEMVRNLHGLGISREQIAVAAKISQQEVDGIIVRG